MIEATLKNSFQGTVKEKKKAYVTNSSHEALESISK